MNNAQMPGNANSARKLNELALELQALLEANAARARQELDVADQALYLDVIGKLMTDILVDVMLPLYAKFPELKPKELR